MVRRRRKVPHSTSADRWFYPGFVIGRGGQIGSDNCQLPGLPPVV
jgi:hypothetical protein